MKVSKFSLGLLFAAFLFSSFNAVAAVPAAFAALDKVLAPATTELKTKLDGATSDAQLQAGGIGYETKYSTTDKTTENYLARRLGNFLSSSGTARLSVKK